MVTVETPRKSLENEIQALEVKARWDRDFALGALAALRWINNGGPTPSSQIADITAGSRG